MKAVNIQWEWDWDAIYEAFDEVTPDAAAKYLAMRGFDIEEQFRININDLSKEEFHQAITTALLQHPAIADGIFGLPDPVEIPLAVVDYAHEYGGDNPDELISEWLSEKYGFCHRGFELVEESRRMVIPKKMAKAVEGATVCLDLSALRHSEEKVCPLSYGRLEISDDTDNGEPFIDLRDDANNLVCMDGETCTVINETKDYVELENNNGARPVTFKLSVEEFNIAGDETKDSDKVTPEKMAAAVEAKAAEVAENGKSEGHNSKPSKDER